jgi:hypothetical protein
MFELTREFVGGDRPAHLGMQKLERRGVGEAVERHLARHLESAGRAGGDVCLDVQREGRLVVHHSLEALRKIALNMSDL